MLQALQTSSADSLEACILECPAGLQALVEVLRDPREEVRNEVILLLGQVSCFWLCVIGAVGVMCALRYGADLQACRSSHACFMLLVPMPPCVCLRSLAYAVCPWGVISYITSVVSSHWLLLLPAVVGVFDWLTPLHACLSLANRPTHVVCMSLT